MRTLSVCFNYIDQANKMFTLTLRIIMSSKIMKTPREWIRLTRGFINTDPVVRVIAEQSNI